MKKNKIHVFICLLVMVYLLLPIVFTILYSVASKWQTTLLPEGLSLQHYVSLIGNPRFLKAILRSITAAGLSIVFSFSVLLPVIYLSKVHFPWLDRMMKFLSMLPFAISGVILAVGLTKIYSRGSLAISGTLWLLVGAYFVVIMPFMYQGIRTSMDNIDAASLIHSAKILGASEWTAFWKVIFPNILKGVSASVLLSFALLMGEFVLANILVGGNYETIQVFMFWSRGVSGHYSSAIVTIYFLIIVAISTTVLNLNHSKKEDSQ